MTLPPSLDVLPPPSRSLDRLGVAASALCAVHCLATPVLLVAAPALGGWWTHPAAHWLLGAPVLTLALVALGRGYLRHRRAWILALGLVGAGLVGTGLVAPQPPTPAVGAEAGCADGCCPSLEVDERGGWTLEITPLSLVTLAGGLCLIGAHVGNLRAACPSPCCD